MRLTFHFERVGWPLSSFLGLLDLKTGVQIALYFAIINKVAGVYGLIALLTGAGGTVAQLSLYIYSVGALVASIWAMRAVNEEDPKRTLYFAHLFFADHILNTVWTVFFAVDWWVYTPHDGRRIANSPAQEALIEGYIGKHIDLAPADRIVAAETLWKEEKNVAMTIIVLGWLSKFYLAALIYSFAHHLRRGTYRSLPLSRSQPSPKETYYQPTSALPAVYDEEDDAPDAFYARSPATPVFSPINPSVSHEGHRGTPSTGAFADFVAAPRTRGNGARSAGGSTVNLTADVGGRV